LIIISSINHFSVLHGCHGWFGYLQAEGELWAKKQSSLENTIKKQRTSLQEKEVRARNTLLHQHSVPLIMFVSFVYSSELP
jgi:hypothetical protein